MKALLKAVEGLEVGSVGRLVERRIKEFESFGRKNSLEVFKELCFCILTANYNAERAMEIQKEVGDGFLTLPEKKLAAMLKESGYRYPNTRARYIMEARKHRNCLKKLLDARESEDEIREWLVGNVKGLGFKEASHFLRNVGCKNVAIIDFHITDILSTSKLIEKPKSMTKAKYLEIERVLKKIAGKLKLNLAELDLYLWYLETGKILK